MSANTGPPRYSLETDYLEADIGTSPTVTFTVVSDPPLRENTEHFFKKSDGSKVTRRFKIQGNSITFRNIKVEDSGLYTISCCNDEGEEGKAEIELDITSRQPPNTSG